MYAATIHPVANPDFGETRPPCASFIVYGETLADLSRMWLDHMRGSRIGGGNFPTTAVIGPCGPVGTLAYNGRVFSFDGKTLIHDSWRAATDDAAA